MGALDQHESPTIFNPFEDGFYENPYDQYARLRARDPIHRSAAGPWVLTRHAEIESLLRNPELSVEIRGARAGDRQQRGHSYDQFIQDLHGRHPTVIHVVDPPVHTRLRRMVSRAFTPFTAEKGVDRLRAMVDELLDDVAAAGGMDVVVDFARTFPIRVISQMIGIADGDADQMSEWSHRIAATLDPILPDEEVREAYEAFKLLTEYMQDLLRAKRQRPSDDLLSALLLAEEDGKPLTEDEILDNVLFLFAAGHETTANLIANGLLAFLQNPDALAQVRADPSLAANAVEECLRYDSPVQFARRMTVTELQLDGHVIAPASMVLASLGSANRDPAFWGPTADDFDVRRPSARKNLAFGGGIHHCLGASLSRLEGQVALTSIITRFPNLTLAGPVVRNERIVLRGLKHLEVSV